MKLHVSQDRDDINALCAVLLDRYCGKLLDFKFDSDHRLNDTTILNAKAVNKAFPYIEEPAEIHVKTDLRDVQMNEIERVSSDVPDKLLMDAFYTNEIKNIILKKYSEEVYSYVSEDLKTRSYFPLTHVFPLLGICKIMKDTVSPDTSPCSPADFIIDTAAKHTDNENEVAGNASLHIWNVIMRRFKALFRKI